MTATQSRAALAVAVLLLLVAGSAVAATPPPTPDPALVARAPYAAGWAFAVTRQTGPDRPGDNLTVASCQWDVDGRLGPDRAYERNEFLKGCGDAVRDTDLENR